jgi:hypothetical protein
MTGTTRATTRTRGRSSRVAARLVWVIAGLGIVATALLLASYATTGGEVTAVLALAALSIVGAMLAFIVSGALIVSRQPGNIVGWLLMVPGLVLPLSTLATNWLGSQPPPQQMTPLLWVLMWALGWSWILLIFPILHLLLTFPDGRLPSRRWRAAVALEVAMISIFLGYLAFRQDLNVLVEDEVAWTLPNPLGFLPNDAFDGILGVLWGLGLVVATLVSVAAVVIRFRRGSTVERQQLKWPLLAVVLFGSVYAGASLDQGLVGDGSVLFGLSLAGIPISVAIAVLRYRLYAIDHIISRTVSWAVITAILLVVFVGGVLALQALLSGVTRDQTLAVAASTLGALVVFQPLRRRVQHAVDRRFDRARYDGQRLADAFAVELRQQVDVGAAHGALIATARSAVQPQTATVWLRGTGR